MRKIVLTSIGSLGDLHPFIALALALKDKGFRPVLALPADHVGKAENAGLEAVAVLPSFNAIAARMGMSTQAATHKIMSNQRVMLEQMILPELESCAAKLDAVAEGAVAIVSSVFVLAASMIAEKRALPFIGVILQPMAMLSAYDPPFTPDFRFLRHDRPGPLGRGWNRFFYAATRQVLHLLYGRRLDRARAALGLGRRGGKYMLEAGRTAALTLCAYAPSFGPLMPDAPPQARVIGFPVFDSECGRPAQLPPGLADFLDSGPAPLVFTLGSFAVHSSGDFYSEAAKITRTLGKRAVLLTGNDAAQGHEDDVFVCNYAPHSALFPRAAAIIHHGGMGTTGQALSAGHPQIVVPHMGDQFDNGHRIERLGVGRSIPARRFSASNAAPILQQLLRDPEAAQRASALAQGLADGNAADEAVRLIADHLTRCGV